MQVMLEPDVLRTFVAIAETGSFSAAADAVARTPSAVSMQMKKLETQLGRELFARQGRGVTLAPGGEELLAYAKRLIRLNEETVAHFLAPPLEGSVRLGTPDDFATRFLPEALARFACAFPRVRTEVVCDMSVNLIPKLDAGELDMTLITREPCSSAAQRGKIIRRERLVWAGLDGGKSVKRRPLPLTLAPSGCAWRNSSLVALEAVAVPYDVIYTSAHYAGQKAAMLADLALAPVPESIVEPPLVSFGEGEGLPPAGEYELALLRCPAIAGSELLDTLECHIVESFAHKAGYLVA